jgi:hypothetical protein
MTELVNQKEFASHCDVTQQSISLAIKRGDVIRDESGLIDLDNEKNYQYLRAAGERAKKRAKNKRQKVKAVKKAAKEDYRTRRLLEELAKDEAKKNELREQLGKEINESLSETELLDRNTALSRNQIQTAKAQYLYDNLLDKEIVLDFCGVIENVIRKQGLTVGARCAPEIAAEFGRNTPEGRRFIQGVIDKEQGRFLKGMKRAVKKTLRNKKKK